MGWLQMPVAIKSRSDGTGRQNDPFRREAIALAPSPLAPARDEAQQSWLASRRLPQTLEQSECLTGVVADRRRSSPASVTRTSARTPAFLEERKGHARRHSRSIRPRRSRPPVSDASWRLGPAAVPNAVRAGMSATAEWTSLTMSTIKTIRGASRA